MASVHKTNCIDASKTSKLLRNNTPIAQVTMQSGGK